MVTLVLLVGLREAIGVVVGKVALEVCGGIVELDVVGPPALVVLFVVGVVVKLRGYLVVELVLLGWVLVGLGLYGAVSLVWGPVWGPGSGLRAVWWVGLLLMALCGMREVDGLLWWRDALWCPACASWPSCSASHPFSRVRASALVPWAWTCSRGLLASGLIR